MTPDGRRVYFASNVGWGVGSAGSTTSAIFEVEVTNVRVRALGWLGTFSGIVQDVRPSPDGKRLLIVLTRHVSNMEVQTLVYTADSASRQLRELVRVDAGKGRLSVLDSACWLADSRHVALSVAYPAHRT
ncbi:LpqB family beta-propeller domain-containing protein [Deinococcus malanensis]|uniref:LpqB family beta-propeller domain-containing protein n=1 Tax=Deinococcus malanensis TaxID=1706855 RepID=UPI003639387A